MLFMVCIVPVCPMRAEAAHRSEQTSQLLFGEMAEVLEQAKDFIKVRALHDNYEGWCQSSQLEELTALPEKRQQIMTAEWVNTLIINGQIMHVPFGSSLALLNNGRGRLGRYEISFEGLTMAPGSEPVNDELVKKFAYLFLNTPYQWGGRSVFGADCSGFTQLVFSCLNVPLPRDAYQQATQGTAIGFLQEARCGDLAFFDNEAGKITHTGILLDANTIIHSSGKVRVDAIDNFGIINTGTGKRTHNLRVIKRLF